MSTEENKTLHLRMIEEVLNQGNSLPPEMPPGREGVKLFLGMFRSAFPDIHETVDDIIAERE